MTKQTQLFEQSKKKVPGGVHSPVRSFKGLESTPRFIARAEGAMIYDVEGKDYIDFCMSFGPLILGHRHPKVEEQLHKALERGWSFGACEPYSLQLAEFLLERLPYGEQIRFVNSGTEAVMTALRLARGATKRDKIIKFNGCYHGHMDALLIKAGSGLAGAAEASSAGVPQGVAQDTFILELGDEEKLRECFAHSGQEIAAIIIEPLPANNGLLPQPESFLKLCRELCHQHQSLLIFDEVISGFRIGFGGMVEQTGITPDIVTYGKIIGGGLPVGAIVARAEIMENLAPVGNVYQAGTLSANPLAMVAGLTTLELCTPDTYQFLSGQTQKIVDLMRRWLKEFQGGRYEKTQVVHHGSLFWLHPQTTSPITDIGQIPANLASEFKPIFEEWLKRGVYLAPNAYEVGFVSLAHNDSVLVELERRLFS